MKLKSQKSGVYSFVIILMSATLLMSESHFSAYAESFSLELISKGGNEHSSGWAEQAVSAFGGTVSFDKPNVWSLYQAKGPDEILILSRYGIKDIQTAQDKTLVIQKIPESYRVSDLNSEEQIFHDIERKISGLLTNKFDPIDAGILINDSGVLAGYWIHFINGSVQYIGCNIKTAGPALWVEYRDRTKNVDKIKKFTTDIAASVIFNKDKG